MVHAHHQVMGKAYQAIRDISFIDQVTVVVLSKIDVTVSGNIGN